MEIAVPLIALGGLYVASNTNNDNDNKKNTNNKNKRENFQNLNQNNGLPNTQTPAVNYPKLKPVGNSNPNKYRDPNQVTDKFFNPKVYEEYENGPDQFLNISKSNEFKSLTGNVVSKNDFKHNNMAPFFGSKVLGSTINPNVNETILDNLVGSGSQVIEKKERAPLFKPQKDVNFAYGAPNQSDFYQSRQNPSSNMSNVKLWDSITVGPGLDAGYCADGELGFNSGMAARDKWVDRNVDQLRTKTNPKVTYGLQNHEGPAYFSNTLPPAQETQGKVEKHLPDTYYINSPSRYFTTTGQEKAQMARAIEVSKDVNRATTSQEYYGADSNPGGNLHYVETGFEESKKNILKSKPILNPSAKGQGNATVGDYGMDSYVMPNNNRNNDINRFGAIQGMVKAAIAPIMDILRPTRKEDIVENCNGIGNINSTVSAPRIQNPEDKPATTIRETTGHLLDNNHLNVENHIEGGAYVLGQDKVVDQQRDSTNCEYYGDGGNSSGVALYNAAYNQRNNVNKTYRNRPNQGNMKLFQSNENIKIDKLDSDRRNNRMWVPNSNSSINSTIPSVETYGKFHAPQYYDNCQNCERINPDILNAFKENPYTKSLSSY